MSTEAVGVPSPAELLERIKSKLKNHQQVLWPAVSEQIQFLKALKTERARKDPDQEYRTVFHLDIDRALMKGLVVDVMQVAEARSGLGCNCQGLRLRGRSPHCNGSVVLGRGCSAIYNEFCRFIGIIIYSKRSLL